MVEIAGDKQAQDIILLDVRGVVGFSDYFVILSGETSRQMDAIYDEIVRLLKKEGVLPLHYEGSVASGWLLIDYGDIIVHIFSPLEREYYRLDELWGEASTVVRIQ